MFWPASTGSGLSAIVTPRSAEVMTVVGSVSVLLAGFVSTSFWVTVAVFEIVPAVVGMTTIVMVACASPGSVPMAQVTVLAASVHVPCVELAETKVTLAGNVSVATTPVAVVEPRFWTASV